MRNRWDMVGFERNLTYVGVTAPKYYEIQRLVANRLRLMPVIFQQAITETQGIQHRYQCQAL